MGANTHIEWADYTFNPWEGCTKVSPGCANCYAENRNARFGGGTAPNWGKGAPRRRTSASNWAQPVKWNEHHERCLEAWATAVSSDPAAEAHRPARPRVFCASLADWLDDEVPVEWLADLLALIYATPQLDWLLLTKRPELFHERMLAVQKVDSNCRLAWKWRQDGNPPPNIWIGVTVENQALAKQRLWDLNSIPARVHFVSAEPLLGPLDLYEACYEKGMKFGEQAPQDVLFFDWLICGGESGPNARPMHPDWARSLRDQCKAGGVAFFFKQWGEWCQGCPTDPKIFTRIMGPGILLGRFGKSACGRKLDGREHNEMPEGAR